MIQPWDIAIDVSDNNEKHGKIDWRAVYAAGIRIAFVKFMEYPGHDYPSGPEQAEAALGAGLAVVPYWFLRPVENAQGAAREFVRRADLKPGMAAAIDWEGRASQTCTPAQAEAIGIALQNILTRPPIGYWGIPGSSPAAPTDTMRGWDRWVPRYPVVGANAWASLPERVRTMPGHWWLTGANGGRLPRFGQYTAWGRVPGIAGVVDRSVAFAESAEEAVAWVAGGSAIA